MCSLWFSVSMAKHHWHDLHRALCPDEKVFESEMGFLKFRRQMARNNSRITDYFFFQRGKVMLYTFFLGPRGFESDWNWLRFELQNAGRIMLMAESV